MSLPARRISFALENADSSFVIEGIPPLSNSAASRLDYNLRQHGNDSNYRTVESYAVRETYRDDPLSKDIHPEYDRPQTLSDLVPFTLKGRRKWIERLLLAFIFCVASTYLYHRHKASKYSQLEIATRAKPLRHTTALSSFRDNLWSDAGYVTSFPYGGLTNQLLETFKLVHLGHRLDRIAILPDLTAVHGEGSNVPFSTFFDLGPAFSHAANVSLTEWSKVKFASKEQEPESLSCWGSPNFGPQPLLEDYKIRTTFWPAPTQLTVPIWDFRALSFPSIEVLVTSDQTEWLNSVRADVVGSSATDPAVPDDKVLCFANLFYVRNPVRFISGVVDSRFTVEELDPTDPVWHDVGRHLHFNKDSNVIADEILSYLIGYSYRTAAPRSAALVPEVKHKLSNAGTPYITVHLRQGDFIALSRAGNPLSAYVDAVELLQRRLSRLLHPTKKHFSFGANKNSDHLPILFATDSNDIEFIHKVKAIGWIFIDHTLLKTASMHTGWHPAIIDSIILSRSVGFVGSKQSTFSYIAARRVEDWSGGLTTIVGDLPIPALASKGHYDSSDRFGRKSNRVGAAGRDRLNGR